MKTRITWQRLQCYITRMAPKWKEIGTYLIDQSKLEAIECNCNKVEQNIRAVLREWEKSAGPGGCPLEFYWSVLIVVLQCVGEGDLAMDLIQECQNNSIDPAYS